MDQQKPVQTLSALTKKSKELGTPIMTIYLLNNLTAKPFVIESAMIASIDAQ